ncbi:MAG: Uma2 family endonuclease [Deltaproteobacteria bacterium]|nr:Uma2 family endonuclease [Deltaproteobacteria bacterium]
MVAPTRHRYTLQDYLEVEELGAVRHEYSDGEIFAMAGGTPEHAALAAALLTTLGVQLRGRPCRPYSSDLRLRVPATGLATYPDAAVICGEPVRDSASPTHVTNPTILAEVLSPSTEAYDRGEKRQHYEQLDSLREYVLVAQERRAIDVYARAEDGGPWTHRAYGPGERVVLASLGLELEVDALYADAGLGV